MSNRNYKSLIDTLRQLRQTVAVAREDYEVAIDEGLYNPVVEFNHYHDAMRHLSAFVDAHIQELFPPRNDEDNTR
jgi:hypothetical protein